MSGESEDARSFVEACEYLASASRSWGYEEYAVGNKLAIVLKNELCRRKDEVLGDDARAVLVSYQSDATSFLCRHQVSMKSEQGTVQRRGKHLDEFLCERLVCKSIGPRGVTLAIFTRPPRILSAGKRVANLFQAAVDIHPVPRIEVGMSALVVEHLCFDRAVHDAMTRLLRARRAAYYSPESGVFPAAGDEILPGLKHIIVDTGCAAHDASGSLKWAMARWGTSEVHDNIYLAILALRQTFHHLVAHVCKWLTAVVIFDRSGIDDEDERQFWSLLGVQATWLDDFVEIGASFHGGQLHCRDSLRGDGAALEKISRVVLFTMRWPKFVMTRWLTVGSSCRSLMVSLILGIDDLMRRTRQDPLVSEYHAHTWDRLGDNEKTFVLICSLSSYPAESFLADILEDDRIGMHANSLVSVVQDEVRYLGSVRESSWRRFAVVLGIEAWSNLQGAVIGSALVSVAYLTMRCLRPAMGLPWSLCRGDISSNLASLGEAVLPPNTDAATSQLQDLVRCGWPQDDLANAVRLLRECSWTTKAVEDLHGSIAVTHRYHPEIDAETLSTRSYIHSCRALVRKGDADKIEQRLSMACSRLASNKGRVVSGANLFFGRMMGKLRWLVKASGQTRGTQQLVMKTCSQKWKNMPRVQKAHFEKAAARSRPLVNRRLQDDREHAASALRLHRQRQAELDEQRGLLNLFSSCRLSESCLRRCAADLASPLFDRCTTESIVKNLMRPPMSITADERACLESYLDQPDTLGGAPVWAKVVCSNRDSFRDCMFRSTRTSADKAFYFLFAMQSPQYLSMLVVASMPAPVDGACTLDGTGPPRFRHEYSFGPELSFIDRFDQMVFSTDGDDIEVIPGASHVGCGKVVSDELAKPFNDFTKGFLRPSARNSTGSSRTTIPKECLEKYPWVADILKLNFKSNDGNGDTPQDNDHTEELIEGVVHTEVSDAMIDEAWRQLHDKRTEWSDVQGSAEHFVVTFRGGKNTFVRRGVAFDCVAATARGALPSAFLRDFGMQVMHSFSVIKYGEECASTLAVEVTKRWQYYFDLWMTSEDTDHKFTEEELQSYQPGAAWCQFVAGLDPDSHAWVRAKAVEAVRPAIGSVCPGMARFASRSASSQS